MLSKYSIQQIRNLKGKNKRKDLKKFPQLRSLYNLMDILSRFQIGLLYPWYLETTTIGLVDRLDRKLGKWHGYFLDVNECKKLKKIKPQTKIEMRVSK